MAKPGPALALAALAAFFLMRGKGGGGGTNGVNKVPDGTKVPNDSPSDKPATPSGGGTKVPHGTGAGGGKWSPPDLSPDELWISPDCQVVVEGPDYFDDVFLPRFLAISGPSGDVDDSAYGEFLSTEVFDDSFEWAGGGPYVYVYAYIGIVLNLMVVTDESLVGPATGPYMFTPPHSCAMQFPAFHIYSEYNGLQTAADEERFRGDMEEFAEEYPAMATWLLELETRLFADASVDENAAKWLYALV